MKVYLKLDPEDVDEIVRRRLEEIHRWSLDDKVSEYPSPDCDEVIKACKVLRKYHYVSND